MIFQKCVDYYYAYQDDLIQLIESQKKSYAKELRKEIFDVLQEWLIPYAIHYDLEEVKSFTYDNIDSMPSGIVTNGIISSNQTINSFLINEFTGDTLPIYNDFSLNDSFNFSTYGSELNGHLDHFTYEFLYDFFYTYFSKHFNCIIDENTFNSISESCYYFNYIKQRTFLAKSLHCSSALKLCGISPNMMLFQIIGM